MEARLVALTDTAAATSLAMLVRVSYIYTKSRVEICGIFDSLVIPCDTPYTMIVIARARRQSNTYFFLPVKRIPCVMLIRRSPSQIVVAINLDAISNGYFIFQFPHSRP